jgi:hypothetical protein
MAEKPPVVRVENEAINRLRKMGRNPLVREGASLLVLYWTYSFVRWFVARDNPYEPFDNAFKIVHLEKQLGIFIEATVQSALVDHALGVVHFANWFYTLGYFPILVLAGVLLYRFDRRRFHIFKLTFLLGLGFALALYSLFPLAPPRMLPEFGFVDTQQIYGSDLYNHKSVISFYNPYAAMPSLHFGWALLVGMMAYAFDRRALKVIGVTYPCCMALVIVTTGHHYLLDIVGGGVVVGLAYSLVQVLSRMRLVPVLVAVGSRSVAYYGKNPAESERTSSVAPPTFRAVERIPRHASDALYDLLPIRRRPAG